MYRIKTLNKISPAGLSVLDQTRYTISTDVENEDGILVRSADMHDYAFPDACGPWPGRARALITSPSTAAPSGHRGIQYPRRQRQCGEGAGGVRPAVGLPKDQ